jgi:hypothetical protein
VFGTGIAAVEGLCLKETEVKILMKTVLYMNITLDWDDGLLSGADPLQDPLSLAYFRSR